jgi:hypothetical protein
MQNRGYFCLFFDQPSHKLLQSIFPDCEDLHVTNLVIDDPEEIARLKDVLHFIGNRCYAVDVNENLKPVALEHPITIKIIGVGKLKTRKHEIVTALKIQSLINDGTEELDAMKKLLMNRFGLQSDCYGSKQIYHITVKNVPIDFSFQDIPDLKLTSCVFSAR